VDGETRFDVDTPLETWFSAMTWALGAAFMIVLAVGFVERLHGRLGPPLVFWSLVPFCGAVAAGILRRTTDSYYVVRSDDRRIDYHLRVLTLERDETLIDGDDIAGVTGEADAQGWFRVAVRDRAGALHAISDGFDGEDGRRHANARGTALARTLNVTCTPACRGGVPAAAFESVEPSPWVSVIALVIVAACVHGLVAW